MRSRTRTINDSGAIVGTATYTPTGTSDPTPAGSHGVLLLPAKVSWVAVADNTPIDDNNDPVSGNPMPGGGKRIYPDQKNPSDTGTGRNKVTLRVDTGGSGAGWTVYVKAFDVADPTPDSNQVIHPHGTATGDSVGGDNFTDPESTPLTGSFTSHDSTVDTAHATLDSTGKADFEFNVGYQPGNNYRVAVTFFKPDALSSLQVTDSTQPGYVPMDANKNPSGFSGAMSPPLTVWRRLWIEQDSMAAVATTGTEKNFISGSVVSITRDSPVTGQSTIGCGQLFGDSANRFEDGTMTIDGTNYPIISNTANSLVADSVVITGTPSDAAVLGKAYTLVDDDDMWLPSGWTPPLPNTHLVTSSVVSLFSPAYILAVDAATYDPSHDYNPNKTVPFELNPSLLVEVASGNLRRAEDLTTSNQCWTHLLVASYQPDQGEDLDPDTETPLDGVTFKIPFIQAYSTVFLETIRDNWKPVLSAAGSRSLAQQDFIDDVAGICAHEIAHSPGSQGEAADHAEGGLMGANAPLHSHFLAPTLLRMRESKTWNGD